MLHTRFQCGKAFVLHPLAYYRTDRRMKKEGITADLHMGHRERLRNRFLNEGLDGFEEHQVLELLLFHVIPRRDTNQLAHLLLQRFGSLSAVLECNAKDLQAVPGIGQQAAFFLALIPPLTRRYLNSRRNREKPTLDHPSRCRQYIIPLMAGRTEEVFYVLSLDNQCRLLFADPVSQGTVNEAYIHPRVVVETVLRHKATRVILAHNHPTGSLKPSSSDLQITRTLVQALAAIGVLVLDHLIVGGDSALSFAEEGLLNAPPAEWKRAVAEEPDLEPTHEEEP